jgi:hypothetical protein
MDGGRWIQHTQAVMIPAPKFIGGPKKEVGNHGVIPKPLCRMTGTLLDCDAIFCHENQPSRVPILFEVGV